MKKHFLLTTYMMYLLIIYLFLPLTYTFVTVKIHRYSIYHPRSPCALLRNISLSVDASIQTCIWECVHEYDCQTAVYFNHEKVCIMYAEFHTVGDIQSTGNVWASVICYQKNHNPIITCSSSAAPSQEKTTVFEEMTCIGTVSTSAASASTTTANTYVPICRVITNLGDTIVAIYNATINGSSLNSTNGTGQNQYRAEQGPTVCIDFLDTTCLNFGQSSLYGPILPEVGVGTGIYTIPQVGASILLSFRFKTGVDNPNRDPLIISLEGSNATGSDLSLGSSWTLLYHGDTGLSSYPFNETRLAWGPIQNVSNTRSFTAYRMIVLSQRGADICTQFSEIRLFGLV